MLTIQGNQFYLDGKSIRLWGIRAASASQSEENTEKIIAALDDYKSHGANSINVYVQGSSGGFSDPFINNGMDIKEDHLRRLIRIIEECRKHAIVPIVGIFYQRAMADVDAVRNLETPEDVYNAVETITTKLMPYRNLIINIANEQNSFFYQNFSAIDFRNPQTIISLCEHVKKTDPERIVGGGGYNDSLNVIIGKSEFVDVLLFDTFGEDIENNHHSAWHYDYFREMGVPDKPFINVEIFGGWTKKFMPPGVYPQKQQDIHTREIDVSLDRPGLQVQFHSNPWCQGPSMGDYPVRYELGGNGTEENPGIQWWFDHLYQTTNGE
ncbi:MAG: hypothetical protein GF372_04835 [Candidatus Marinimicrobia bacterium]|nr:hypothetical protein [Candidatus Neomarinimicrobiota bacterium]